MSPSILTRHPLHSCFAGLLLAGLTMGAGLRGAQPASEHAPTSKPAKVTIEVPWRFAKDIEKFDAADAATAPVKDSVLFIGSSTFTRWNVAKYFPGLPVFNRAFGGSTLPDVIFYIDKVAFRYQPKVVVIYCGENDIAAGATPEAVEGNFVRLIELLKAGCPQAKLVFLGLKPSPVRQEHWEKCKVANAWIAAKAPELGVIFVDAWPALTTAAGEPRPELFGKDQLHTNDDGYNQIKAVLEPAILKALGK